MHIKIIVSKQQKVSVCPVCAFECLGLQTSLKPWLVLHVKQVLS